jgi:hypothetical protein
MSGGYTYTTIAARREQPTKITVSFYLDEDAWIVVPGAGTDNPHLTIEHGDVTVRVAPRSEAVTREDATIARRLADQAAEYAAEIERLASRQQAEDAGPTAA